MSAKNALLAVGNRSMSNVSISSICNITCIYTDRYAHNIEIQCDG